MYAIMLGRIKAADRIKFANELALRWGDKLGLDR
jgi:hypothetical protein